MRPWNVDRYLIWAWCKIMKCQVNLPLPTWWLHLVDNRVNLTIQIEISLFSLIWVTLALDRRVSNDHSFFISSRKHICGYSGTKLAQNFREKWLLPAGKLGRSDCQIGRSYSAKFRYFLSVEKQISHYTYYCHLMEGETWCNGSRLSDNVTTACICVVTEWRWASLKKKKKKKKKKIFFFFFLGRLPLLPGSHLGRNFGP